MFPQESLVAALPVPALRILRYVESPNGRTVGNGRRFYPVEWLVSHNAKGRAKKGCGHERENPRSGLLSADTFGAASFAETPSSICRDFEMPSRPGDFE